MLWPIMHIHSLIYVPNVCVCAYWEHMFSLTTSQTWRDEIMSALIQMGYWIWQILTGTVQDISYKFQHLWWRINPFKEKNNEDISIPFPVKVASRRRLWSQDKLKDFSDTLKMVSKFQEWSLFQDCPSWLPVHCSFLQIVDYSLALQQWTQLAWSSYCYSIFCKCFS